MITDFSMASTPVDNCNKVPGGGFVRVDPRDQSKAIGMHLVTRVARC